MKKFGVPTFTVIGAAIAGTMVMSGCSSLPTLQSGNTVTVTSSPAPVGGAGTNIPAKTSTPSAAAQPESTPTVVVTKKPKATRTKVYVPAQRETVTVTPEPSVSVETSDTSYSSCSSLESQWQDAVLNRQKSRSERVHRQATQGGCNPNSWIAYRDQSKADYNSSSHAAGDRCTKSQIGDYDASGNVCSQVQPQHYEWVSR